MFILLNIRLIQIKRELNNAGFGIIIIPVLLSFLIYASYSAFQNTPDAFYITALLLLTCVSIQSYRNDKLFVISHIQRPHFEIYTEYLALTFPFAVTSLFTAKWFCYPILLAALLIVPFLKFTIKQKTYFKSISSIIPATDFEWISGIRKSFYFLIPLYIFALGFSWFRILPLFTLWFITVLIASFYTECEPLHILKEGNFSPKQLLNRKLVRHSKYITLLYSPVLVINTIFNSDYWVLNLLFIPVQLSLVCYSVCLKYSTYEPNKKPIANGIILSLVSLGSLIPYLLPIPLLMALHSYGKAKNNLNNYLDD
jgi:hypothetical protein